MPGGCVIWVNGAFGVGKTTVARALASELPDALLVDPEDVGRMLRRIIPAALRTSDFQDIPSWRRLTFATIESLLHDRPGPLVVPMTVVDPLHFDETVGRLRRSGITVHHFSLVASPRTIRRRLLRRLSVPWATRHGWASCAVTQNGFIRILSQPSYPSPVSTSQATRLLSTAASTAHHQYRGSDVSILDETIFDRSRIHGPRQLTDVYPLGLAAHHGGHLVTFDRTIALAAVRTASPGNLVVL